MFACSESLLRWQPFPPVTPTQPGQNKRKATPGGSWCAHSTRLGDGSQEGSRKALVLDLVSMETCCSFQGQM